MSRREPTPVIVMAIALCGLLMATASLAVAQTRQPYAVASRTAPATTRARLLLV